MNVQQVYELGGFKGHGFEQQGIFQEFPKILIDMNTVGWVDLIRLRLDTPLVHDTDAV